MRRPVNVVREMARPLRILFVEDDPDGRFVLTCLLERDGHAVEAVADAAAALDALAARAAGPAGAAFDVLLSDVGMPAMDGCELMARVRERYDLPGIALTGFADAAQRERCRAAGFAVFVPKPADFAAVRAALAAVT